MNDSEFETLIRNNLESIRKYAQKTKEETDEKVTYLENLVKTQQGTIERQQQQINLLLTKNFNGEATSV